MPQYDQEFRIILNQTVRVGRRSGYTTTDMGQRRSSGETTMASGVSVHFQDMSGKLMRMPSGDFKKVDYLMFAIGTQDVQPGDLVYPQTIIAGLTVGHVLDMQPVYDFDGHTHHIECLVERMG